ncbi:probable disease resistance protein RF45 [Dioscorea cayenensis subsp. rotundata]|uniref:Probable disease resistance protein RF45 n=1 Tax=Dioscorea cayennensis subsp. rotundata TaxID=55577 RepID=A0AB40AXB5_DIOCR|nr:probable disease resistance protein RF45 [Dioscorea cayenensis subsp. rotundata]
MGNDVPKNLQTLVGLNAGQWIENSLPKLANLFELSINEVPNKHVDALASSLQNLGRLASFSIINYPYNENAIRLDNIITAFSNQHCLKKLYLKGCLKSEHLPDNDVFPQQLVELYLSYVGLKQDPMATLEKLTCLKHLRLDRAYRGKKMKCSATGFPQLLSLRISCLDKLEKWKIEENAMSCLKFLGIYDCCGLKMIPEGLKNVPLRQLKLSDMSEVLVTRIKENTGEDWIKKLLKKLMKKSLIPLIIWYNF